MKSINVTSKTSRQTIRGNAGADLGKMLTDLLQNECRRRKLLGVTGAWPPEIFSILTT